jgi:hypothetical protein
MAIVGTRWVVSKYQTRKDESEIRKEVLRNYISFRNHVVTMDNFVGELIVKYGRFDSFHGTNEREKMSKLLPWGYTHNDLEYYSRKIHFDRLVDFKNEEINEAQIEKKFEVLKKATECYIDFQDTPIEKYSVQYMEFLKKFFNRPAVMQLKALISQYYINPKMFDSNFSAMWEYMMGCYILINRIMYTTNKNDFVERIDEYNDCANYLFYFLDWFEGKLLSEKIKLYKTTKKKNSFLASV